MRTRNKVTHWHLQGGNKHVRGTGKIDVIGFGSQHVDVV
jgi:hypothetical protein